jgi:hypothetical protein
VHICGLCCFILHSYAVIPHTRSSGLEARTLLFNRRSAHICETYTDHGSARHLLGAQKEACLVRDCFALAHARTLNAYSPHIALAELPMRLMCFTLLAAAFSTQIL